MPSKTNREGYLLIDHRYSPGLPASDGFDPEIFGPGRTFESGMWQCSHCQRGIVKNPLRQRARAYCAKCDHYICDNCETNRHLTGGECRPFRQIADEAQEAAVRNILLG